MWQKRISQLSAADEKSPSTGGKKFSEGIKPGCAPMP
jgi:hypothetical protein